MTEMLTAVWFSSGFNRLWSGSCKQEAQIMWGGPLQALNLWRHIWDVLIWCSYHRNFMQTELLREPSMPALFSSERRVEIFLSYLASGGYYRVYIKKTQPLAFSPISTNLCRVRKTTESFSPWKNWIHVIPCHDVILFFDLNLGNLPSVLNGICVRQTEREFPIWCRDGDNRMTSTPMVYACTVTTSGFRGSANNTGKCRSPAFLVVAVGWRTRLWRRWGKRYGCNLVNPRLNG